MEVVQQKHSIPNITKDFVIVSETYAKSAKKLSLYQQKILIVLLAGIKDQHTKEGFLEIIQIPVMILATLIGLGGDKISDRLRLQLRSFSENSKVIYYNNGMLVESTELVKDVSCKRGLVSMRWNGDALKFFFNLKDRYIRKNVRDVISFQFRYTGFIYDYLIMKYRQTQEWCIPTSELKSILNIPAEGIGSYMNKKSGQFERYHFETQVLDGIIKDLNGCRHLRFAGCSKVKEGHAVAGYRFKWSFLDEDDTGVMDKETIPETETKPYRMLSLDTASTNTGWAYYEAGILKDSGVLTAEGDTETKLNTMCVGIINLLDRIRPGTVVIELTVVDRGTGTQRLLSEIVGAVRGWAACHSYDDGIGVEFVQYRPSTWRKLATPEGESFPKKRKECKKWSVALVNRMYGMQVTDDRADAILIGQARINEMVNIRDNF